jgi:hypothetical protein
MDNLIPVKDNMGLLRDPNTNSILNVNVSDYENYMRLKAKKESEISKIKKIESEIDVIKTDLSDIKNILLQMLNTEK